MESSLLSYNHENQFAHSPRSPSPSLSQVQILHRKPPAVFCHTGACRSVRHSHIHCFKGNDKKPSSPSSRYPQSSLGAVLVLLYEEKGKLRVLLTTRSTHVRTHAGQTALPGGKRDSSDENLTVTAVRPFLFIWMRVPYLCFKESGSSRRSALPLDCPSIYTLGLLDPFISLHKVLVNPVIALLTQPGIFWLPRSRSPIFSGIVWEPFLTQTWKSMSRWWNWQ